MSHSRNVVVWHQILSINHIDFEKKTIYVINQFLKPLSNFII